MTDDDKPAPTNPLSLVNTHWVHRADQRVRVILGLNESGGFIMSIPDRVEIVETVADLATLEADWERVKWMPGWFTEDEAAKVRDGKSIAPIRGPENRWDARCPRCGEIANLSRKIDGQRCCEKCAAVRAMSSVHVVADGPVEMSTLLTRILAALDRRHSDTCALCGKDFHHDKACPYLELDQMVNGLDAAAKAR